MTLPLDLDPILEKLQTLLEGETLYLHRSSGVMRILEDETIALLADLDEDLMSPSEVEHFDGIRTILLSDDYIPLPHPLCMDDPDLGAALRDCLGRAGVVVSSAH